MLVYELSDDINKIQMHRELTEIIVAKDEKVICYEYFFNMNISLIIRCRPFKFLLYIDKIYMQGSLSQTFDLGPSFHFIKCKSLYCKK